MEITLTTPALIFPTVSVLLLAYTNRYVAIANVIRTFKKDYDTGYEHTELLTQTRILYRRVEIIRQMQTIGVTSLILAALSMFLIFVNWQIGGKVVFGLSLVLLISSLLMSVYEMTLSNKSILIEVQDIERKEQE